MVAENHKKSVLIVDDEEVVRRSYQRILTEAGYDWRNPVASISLRRTFVDDDD